MKFLVEFETPEEWDEERAYDELRDATVVAEDLGIKVKYL